MIYAYDRQQGRTAGLLDETVGTCALKRCGQADFVDGADAGSRNFQYHPFFIFSIEKTLGLQVRLESALGFAVRVRNAVSNDGVLTRDLAYF